MTEILKDYRRGMGSVRQLHSTTAATRPRTTAFVPRFRVCLTRPHHPLIGKLSSTASIHRPSWALPYGPRSKTSCRGISLTSRYGSRQRHLRSGRARLLLRSKRVEFTSSWDERDQVHGHGDGLTKRAQEVATGLHRRAGADVCHVDDAGDPDETEIKWFDSEADAIAAIAAKPEAIGDGR